MASPVWIRRSAIEARVGWNRIAGKSPVILFQMAKVGSTSLWHAMEDAGQIVYFVHSMESSHSDWLASEAMDLMGHKRAYHLVRGDVIYKRIVLPGRPARYISLTRDPVARNLSSFFQIYVEQPKAFGPTPPLERIFELFFDRFRHNRPIEFFDSEYKGMLGIDVYAKPFDPAKGFVEIAKGPARVLILRLESGPSVIEKATAQFLGIPGLTLPHKNESRQKPLGGLYQRFVSEIKLPDEYVERLINAKYTRHFYSDQERERMADRWLRHPR